MENPDAILRNLKMRRSNYVRSSDPKMESPDPLFQLQGAIVAFNYNLGCGIPSDHKEGLITAAKHKLNEICNANPNQELTIEDVDTWYEYI